MLLPSIIETRGSVSFPEFTGERVYMEPFLKADGLPDRLARWRPTVEAMLDGIDTDLPIYLMVDQGVVRAGSKHRRPGLHVDGYWNPGVRTHGSHGAVGMHGSHVGTAMHGGTPCTPSHGAFPRHSPVRPVPRHGGVQPAHFGSPVVPSHGSMSSSWAAADFSAPEAIVLASSVSAARGLVGGFAGPVGEGGCCAHVDLSGLAELPMAAGVVYAGNVCCLHESLPVAVDCLRTVVRLNVPGWTPSA